jgi:hypothetical protein
MTTLVATQPQTTLALLFGATEDHVEALVEALGEQHTLRSIAAVQHLSHACWQAAEGEIASVARGLLDLDLGDLVLAGWRKYADLIAAAKRTLADPDTPEVMELASHRVTSTHHPSVDLLLDDVRVASVRFELTVEFLLKGLVTTMRAGRLVAVSGGSCDVTATLAAEGSQLAKREAHLQLPLVIRLGDGIPLLHAGEATGAMALA